MTTIQKPITLAVVSAMMLALPEFLTVGQHVVGIAPVVAANGAAGLASVSNTIHNQVNQMMTMMSALSYLAGIGFGLKAALAFKEYSEGVGYSDNEEFGSYDTEAAQPVSLVKEEIKEEQITPVNLEKSAKPVEEKIIPATVVQLEKVRNPLDFEHDVLNAKVDAISILVRELKGNALLKDFESINVVEKTLTSYVPEIASSYVAIPEDLRHMKVNKDYSAYDMAFKQLTLIEDGLSGIRHNLLENSKTQLKVTGKFLEAKFGHMTEN